jgi:L-fuculose-phosphate aldolase
VPQVPVSGRFLPSNVPMTGSSNDRSESERDVLVSRDVSCYRGRITRLVSESVHPSDSDRLRAARAQLVSYGTRLLADGLAVGSAGNLSVRAGDVVAITPSGIPYAELRPAGICLVTLDGAQLPADPDEPPETPSSETPMHLAIYAATGAAAVVHTHSPEVIALSASRPELPAIHYAITGLGGPVRVAPYVRFGSAGLAAAAVEALSGRSAVILRNHGAVTYGGDLAQAYDRAVLLEWLARSYRLALSYGEPAILSPAELDEVTAETQRRRYGERKRRPNQP